MDMHKFPIVILIHSIESLIFKRYDEQFVAERWSVVKRSVEIVTLTRCLGDTSCKASTLRFFEIFKLAI
jgi:hypothetical protein